VKLGAAACWWDVDHPVILKGDDRILKPGRRFVYGHGGDSDCAYAGLFNPVKPRIQASAALLYGLPPFWRG
jgi:hypothetical protein